MRAALAKANAEAKASREELAKIKADMAAGATDAERTAATLAELRERADASDMRAMRAEVAASKGLTAAQAKRLQGTTVDELEADADELVAAFKPAEGTDATAGTDTASAGRRAGTGRPQEALKPGATPPADQGNGFDLGKTVAAIPF